MESTRPDGSWIGGTCADPACEFLPSSAEEIERFFGKRNADRMKPACRQNRVFAFCRASRAGGVEIKFLVTLLDANQPFPIPLIKLVGDAEQFRPRIESAMKVYSANCAMCHQQGVGGAPRFGVPEDWEYRLRKRRDVLHMHASTGFRNCPPNATGGRITPEEMWDVLDYMAVHVGGRIGR